MAIHTQQSVSGFIASDPQLAHTAKGDARFYARICREHDRREADGPFIELEPTQNGSAPSGRLRVWVTM